MKDRYHSKRLWTLFVIFLGSCVLGVLVWHPVFPLLASGAAVGMWYLNRQPPGKDPDEAGGSTDRQV